MSITMDLPFHLDGRYLCHLFNASIHYLFNIYLYTILCRRNHLISLVDLMSATGFNSIPSPPLPHARPAKEIHFELTFRKPLTKWHAPRYTSTLCPSPSALVDLWLVPFVCLSVCLSVRLFTAAAAATGITDVSGLVKRYDAYTSLWLTRANARLKTEIGDDGFFVRTWQNIWRWGMCVYICTKTYVCEVRCGNYAAHCIYSITKLALEYLLDFE